MSRRFAGPVASIAAGLALIVGPLWLAFGPRAQADVSQLFVGFQFEADADGYSMTGGDPKAQGHPQGAGHVAHTVARLSTGPSGYALASYAWPGGLLGNLGSLMQGAGGAPEETDAFNYPVRAEAFSAGPQEAENRQMKATARDELAEAVASAGPSSGGQGDAFRVGSVDTLSRSTVEGEFGISRSEATVSDINIAEVFTVDSVITTAQARTNSQVGTNSGSARVNGAKVGGFPVIIDENGVRAQDSQNPNVGQAVTQALVDNILHHAQMEIYLTQPQRRSEGGTQEYRSGSLVVSWKASQGDPQFDEGAIFTVAFGGANAFVQANPAIPFTDLPSVEDFFDESGTTLDPGFVGGGSEPTSPDTTDGGSPDTTDGVAAGPRQAIATQDVVNRFDGIAWLLLLSAMVGSALAGRGLLRFQDAVAGGSSGPACPLEGDPT